MLCWGVGGVGQEGGRFPCHFPGTTLCCPVAQGHCGCTHTTYGVSMGWGGSGGRWVKGEGERIVGYKSPQKFFEGANMCPGGQKNPHPAHGKTHPLVRKHTSRGQHFCCHTQDWCPSGEGTSPSCSKAQVQRKERTSLHGKNTHPGEEPRVQLMLRAMGQLHPRKASCQVILPVPGGASCRVGRGGRPPPTLPPIPE